MILDEIRAHKETELAAAQAERPAEELASRVAALPPCRDFAAALRASDGVSLIAEIKRASPSRGVLRADLDVREVARSYEAAGACAVSVLTDERFFQGSLKDLREAREVVSLPLLRKDFALGRYHVLEARAAGADAVLLIVRMLSEAELKTLLGQAVEMGLHALVEVHAEDELKRALDAGADLIGINNRNLDTFEVDIETTFRLRPMVPEGKTVVAESGIRERADVERLAEAGVDAVLVGEALITQPNPGGAAAALLGR